MLLDHPSQRTRTHFIVIALITQPISGSFGDFNADIAVHQLRFQLQNELFDHLSNHIAAQWCKTDHRIQTVTKFWCKCAFNGGCVFPFASITAKANGGFRHL